MVAWLVKRIARWVAGLPLARVRVLAWRCGWLLAHAVRLRRSYVLATLARCLPEKSPRERVALYVEMCRH